MNDLPGVALVSREYPPHFGGGIGTYARHQARALAEAGARVHVISMAHEGTHPRLHRDGPVTVHRVPLSGANINWATAAARFGTDASRVALDLWARAEVDVVEFPEFEGPAAALLAAKAATGAGLAAKAATGARLAGPPVVVHFHTPTEVIFRLRSIWAECTSVPFAAHMLSERLAIHEADALCAPSAFIARFAQRHYALPEQPRVIPYPLPLPPDDAGDADDAADVGASRERVVLHVGRVEPRKGVEVLVRAWALIAPGLPGWTLRFVGADTTTSPARTSLQGHLLSLLPEALHARVHFAGPMPPELVAREQRRAAIVAVPSLWENYPNTCLEAMARATPVLASDAGGQAEMVGDSDAGVVFRSGDERDLARALESLMREPAERLRQRGRAARERVALLADPARVTRARLDLYREVIERARRAPSDHERIARQTAHRAMWRAWRSLAQGRADAIELPTLDPLVARWIDTQPQAAPATEGRA